MAGDRRRSILDRYRSAEGYLTCIRAAAEKLIAGGFMLEEAWSRRSRSHVVRGRPCHEVALPSSCS